MDLTVLLILFITYWVRPSGGSPCSLMATASTNRKGDHKLQLQLQCGESTCRQFDCNDVNEELNITCTGQNCMKVNMYSVCDTPQGICVAPERENCEKAYKTLNQSSECTNVSSQLPPALGALLGIAMVALAVVITGWVWTCWLLKKKGGMKIVSEKQERSFRNPMYTEDSGTQQHSNGDRHQQFHETRVPTYATVSKPSNKRTEGNNFSHGPTNAKTVVGSNSQVHHHQQGLQDQESNYHLLGKQDSSEYNVIVRPPETNDDYADPDEEGEGWGQEENVYHMLEGPATEGEGPLQDEATVYEVPVPSWPPKHN